VIYKLKGTITSSIFIILILLILSLLVLTPMLNMIILGVIFAYGIRPISAKMEPFLKYRSITIIIAMIIVILPLIAIIILSVDALVQSAPSIVNLLNKFQLNNFNSTSIENTLIQQYVPENFQSYIDSSLNAINLTVTDILRGILNYILELVQSIPTIALQLFIFFTSTFYFARDGDKFYEYMDKIIPEDRRGYFNRLIREIKIVIKSIFFGHFLTAIIIGLMGGVGFYVLGYPYALFLGIMTGFLQLIPVIGPWPIYWALAIYDFLTGNIFRGIIVLLFGFFLSGSDIYIRPKLSGKYADIHPLIFLLGFLCGPLVFGMVGFIIGPLILGVTYAAVIAYKKETGETTKKVNSE